MQLKTASLNEELLAIIINKNTEWRFSGEYEDFDEPGTYLCRHCGLALFRSSTKFHSGCGWPSFDENIVNAVKQQPDIDGHRIEILCARCDAHLGHIFLGEQFTDKNTRHCVNSLSLDFVSDTEILDTEEAIFAGGCFWGIEYYFKQLPGVIKTEVGYTGGDLKNPSYQEVCSGNTGHYEALRIIYDPKKITYEDLAKFFFEIHDATQTNGQGPDIGPQYQSVAFYYNETQKNILFDLINQLKNQGNLIATKLLPVSTFWRAETYHQDYYHKTGKLPYCHHYQKKFT